MRTKFEGQAFLEMSWEPEEAAVPDRSYVIQGQVSTWEIQY